MVDVKTKITINANRQKVADFAMLPENAPKWYVNIKSAEKRSDGPIQVGSKIAFTAHFLGKKLAYIYEITVYEPGKKLVMRTADGPFPMETTYTFESLDQGTLMELRNCGSPKGFSSFFAPFMKMAMRSANRKDLKKLKAILEAENPLADP